MESKVVESSTVKQKIWQTKDKPLPKVIKDKWIDILADFTGATTVFTVTGVAHPKGSKICNDVCNTSLLVRRVLTAGNFLGASEIISVDVFQRTGRPNSPTVRFGSLVLFRSLFVDHDLR